MDYGRLGNHKPEWLFEKIADIDIDLLKQELDGYHDQLPWFDFSEADDTDNAVAVAWKDASNALRQGAFLGATRGKRARLRRNPKFYKGYYKHIMEKHRLLGGVYALMEPRSSYAWHIDKCLGFQIPVTTNADCSFIFKLDDNKSYHFTPKPGEAYLVNNMVTHTFINGGSYDRYYLLCVVNFKNLHDSDYKPYLDTCGWDYSHYDLSGQIPTRTTEERSIHDNSVLKTNKDPFESRWFSDSWFTTPTPHTYR